MEDADIINWSKDYFLKWSDFKAEVNPAAYEDSSSKIKFHHTWTVDSEMVNGEIYFLISNIQLTTQFLRHLSWVRIQNSSIELLKHEQGHFDLAELHRFEIISDLKKLENIWHQTRGQNEEQRKQFAREDSGTLIAKEITKWEKIIRQKRYDYDVQTNYGQTKSEQTKFDNIFSKLH